MQAHYFILVSETSNSVHFPKMFVFVKSKITFCKPILKTVVIEQVKD